MTALVGKAKLADLDEQENRDVGIRVANGLAHLTATLDGRDFPPPSRAEVQDAFAHADSIDVKLLGPDGPMDPDEAASMKAAQEARAGKTQEQAPSEAVDGAESHGDPDAALEPSDDPGAAETPSDEGDAPLAGPTPPRRTSRTRSGCRSGRYATRSSASGGSCRRHRCGIYRRRHGQPGSNYPPARRRYRIGSGPISGAAAVPSASPTTGARANRPRPKGSNVQKHTQARRTP